jgi:hypothetical protein
MFIFVVQTLQKKWIEICMKQLADGKRMENVWKTYGKQLFFEDLEI